MPLFMRATKRLRAIRAGDSQVTPPTEAIQGLARTVEAPTTSATTTEADRAPALYLRDPARYQILAEHGRGGLGRVTRVHDRELGRDVAIKELLARDPHRESRFLREALITAHLEHPGIVPVHEAGRWPDGTPFYAMKLVSGRPLRALLDERTAIEDRLGLLPHVIAVADAIAYAHDRKIIHRDLKPDNVMVGSFGETVVIDWGLAKDLTSAAVDEVSWPAASVGGEGLTQVGAILGTRAYMSPEQLHGDPVDQRTDVYAIGVMLWELCSDDSLSLVEPGHRRRVLRRAGIADDLITIVCKALCGNRDDRYVDASALATDLKAFQSGARIRARHYSPLAVLAHWVRHHRAWSLAMLAATAIAVIGGTVYVRNIALERDRADHALERVELTERALSHEHSDLTLKHAQLLLTSDPSAALDMLATYRGSEIDAVNQLRAEAAARGVAVIRATPHTDNLLWAAGLADGSVASLGLDGTIAKTSVHGSSLLANDMTVGLVYAYAKQRLVYLCHAAALCFLDVQHGNRFRAAAELQGLPIIAVALSASGNRLALLLRDGDLRIFDVTDPEHPMLELQHATDRSTALRIMGEDAVVVTGANGSQLVLMNGRTQTFQVPDGALTDVHGSTRSMLFVTASGEGWFVAPRTSRLTTVHRSLCRGSVTDLKFLSGPDLAAYSCHEGTVGLWDLSRGAVTSRMHLDGSADALAVSAAGDYLLAANGKGVIALLDLVTGLTTYYRGQGYRLIALAAPTPEYPYVLSGDVHGGLRAWSLPPRYAHVIATSPYQLISGIYNRHDGSVIATALGQPSLTVSSRAGPAAIRMVGPHVPEDFNISEATNHDWFATFGLGDNVELWSTRPLARSAVFATHHGSIPQVLFTEDPESVLTAGEDGNVIQWTFAGKPHVVAHFDQPITAFALAPVTHIAVIGTSNGALWQATRDGHVVPLRTSGAKALNMLHMPDGIYVCIGFADGEVSLLDTRSGRLTQLTHVHDAIRDIVVTPDNRTIAMSVNDGTVRVGTRSMAAWLASGTTWATLNARARALALTSDGLLVAACTDGIVWLWSAAHRTWLGMLTNAAPSTIAISADELFATTLDNEGQIIAIDLQIVRNIMNSNLN